MCFELFLDLSNVKLSEIMKIKFIDNMIADNSNLYIWSNDESIDKKKLLSKLKRIGITDVYCKELSLKMLNAETILFLLGFTNNIRKVV